MEKLANPPTPTIRQITFANLEIMRTKKFHRFICQNSLLLLHIDSVHSIELDLHK